MKLNKVFKIIFSIICIMTFLTSVVLGTFLFSTLKDVKTPSFEMIKDIKYTKILDSSSRVVEDLSCSKDSYVKYEDIPFLLVNSLLSIEDNEFFYHDGFNIKRIILSFINNLDSSNWKQGGSTLTQQLIKNTILNNEKTYTRKIKEAYLSFLLEQDLSKEEILENFFNRIYFEKSIPGIQYASRAFFNKEVKYLSIPECALLVGLIKSPSQYDPYLYPEKANGRKNKVLSSMYKNNVITKQEYDVATNIHISDILVDKKEKKETYKHQAYLDVVYREVKEITSFDPYMKPMLIETYLDSSLQDYCDKIQEGQIIDFNDTSLQIGGVILSNDSNKVIGVIGGRNYTGKKIFNRAYDLKRNPASTMKPIFPYALGVEHLSYRALTSLNDEPYFYPNTSIAVSNCDHINMGKLSLIESLGYSRNTIALSTLEKVQNQIGEEALITYLKNIGIYDGGPFSLSYGLGGMSYGISPYNLAGAYTVLPNNGIFIKPSTIKKITLLENNQVIYEREVKKKKVLKEETASILTDTLKRMINTNYYNIKLAKPNDVIIGGKTGTNAYPQEIINKYNYPKNADKDIWFAGFSASHTIALWSGFDEIKQDEKTYFYSGDPRRKTAKVLFNKLIDFISIKNKDFNYSNNVRKINVVKGLDKLYIPNELIPTSCIDYVLVPSEEQIETLPYPQYTAINNLNMLLTDNELYFAITNEIINDEIYTALFGPSGFKIKVTSPSGKVTEDFILINSFKYNLEETGTYQFEIYQTFQNNLSLKSASYYFSFTM